MKKANELKALVKDKESGYSKKLLIKKFHLPNGIKESYFINDDNDSVQVFAITDDNKVYCVKQFRPGLEKEQIELPGGGFEEDEDAKDAAIRELKEETGLEVGEIEFLAKLPYNPYSNGHKHLFVAWDCKKTGKIDLDPNEFLKIIVYELEDFKELLKKGQIFGTDCAYLGLDRLKKL